MPYLLISQRAKANPNYNLKDLTGHGRFDVVVRCILAATRNIGTKQGDTIYCYLKGSEPNGWLRIKPKFVDDNDDEISLASKIQINWNLLFETGSVKDLIQELKEPFLLLSEDGVETTLFDGTIVLGAQNDVTENDLKNIPINKKISLGERSLLASHAIIYSRQLNMI